MPSKKKSRLPETRIMVVYCLVALSCLTIIGFVINRVSKSGEENDRVQALNELSSDLDELNVKISEDIKTIESKRTSYCGRGGGKSGPKPIYCYQGIEGVVQDIPNSDIAVVQQQVRSVLLANDVIGFELTNSTDNDGIVHERFESEDCDATTYTRPAGVHDKFPESEYSLELTCFGGEFSEFIYPEKVE